MRDERPLDIADDGDLSNSGELDHRPSWMLLAVGVMVLLVVTVSVATRKQPSVDNSPSNRPESGEVVDGVPGLKLPLDDQVVAALPPGGIDGWLFSIDGLGRLTRTDLTTGEESQISLLPAADIGFAFVISRSRLVQIGTKVIWAGPNRLYTTEATTLEVASIEYPNGPAVMVTNDDSTVWLRTFVSLRPSSSMFSINVDTFDVSDPFAADTVAGGLIVAGATDGVLRYHSPSGGAWELEAGSYSTVDTAIVAGTNGGTVEIRCDLDPTDCATVVHDIATGIDTEVEASVQSSETLLSPTIDAVAVSGQVIYTDGTVIDLPDGGDWTWSADGRFLASHDLIVVDLAGQHPTFQIPDGGRSFASQEALVVLRVNN